MIRATFIAAVLTGVFCAGFAAVIGFVTDTLPMLMVIVLAFVSGFLGSLFARFVLGKGRD
jgi:hypothetical protein